VPAHVRSDRVPLSQAASGLLLPLLGISPPRARRTHLAAAFRLTRPTLPDTPACLDHHGCPSPIPLFDWHHPSAPTCTRQTLAGGTAVKDGHLATATAARSVLDGREHDGRLERVGGPDLPQFRFRFPAPIQPLGTGTGSPLPIKLCAKSAIKLPVSAHFPTDFQVVGCSLSKRVRRSSRGFPTDFQVVGWRRQDRLRYLSRGFPTDFQVVGLNRPKGENVSGRGFPTDFQVVGSRLFTPRAPIRRGFPTDFQVVG